MKVSVDRFPPVTAILRAYSMEETDHILSVLRESGIKSVEIAYNTPNVSGILRYAIEKYGDCMVFGAGTITDMDALVDVVDADVDFVLSPSGFTREMLDYCHAHHVISVPGAFSPSEVAEQFGMGADIVKIFPAVVLGSVYFKQLAGPMGCRPLMAVGGINGKNGREFMQAGAAYLGIGSGMFCRQDVVNNDSEAMRRSVHELETALCLK